MTWRCQDVSTYDEGDSPCVCPHCPVHGAAATLDRILAEPAFPHIEPVITHHTPEDVARVMADPDHRYKTGGDELGLGRKMPGW